jgi:hypothetical protein
MLEGGIVTHLAATQPVLEYGLTKDEMKAGQG